MRKIIFAALLIFGLSPFLQGAAYTTTKAGNWNDSTVWSPAGVPTNGDTVSINHAITVNVDVTVGTSPQAKDVTPAVSINGTSTALTVSAGKILRCRGDLKINPGSNKYCYLVLEAGSSLVFDPSQAVTPSTAAYQLIFKEFGWFSSFGTSGTRCTVMTDKTGGGASAYMVIGMNYRDQGVNYASYTDFNDLGGTSTTNSGYGVAWQSWATASSTGMTIINCNFSGSNCVLDLKTTTNGNVYFGGNYFTNSVLIQFIGYQACFYGGFNTAKTGGSRKITGNGFDNMAKFWYAANTEITDNYMGGSYYTRANTYDLFTNNFIWQDNAHNSSPVNRDMSNCYVANNCTGNPHYLGCDPSGTTIVLSGFVVEYMGTDPTGDVFMASLSASPGTYIIRNSIKLPNANGTSSGAFFSALGNANNSIIAEHNTMHLGGNMDSSGARVGETYDGFTGMVKSYKSNLVWDTTPRGFKLCSAKLVTVPDVVRAADCDYNGGYNFAAGSNGNGYDKIL
ncbi:MAG: hypothetical protein WCI43_06385, partial [Candidatus Firestonebacteria bacterium]